MSFIWPAMLLLLAAVPVGVLLYLSIDRRRRLAASRSGFGTLVRNTDAAPGAGAGTGAGAAGPAGGGGQGRGRLRARIPAALFIVGTTLMVFALARPQSVVSLPRSEGTVILAYDVSGSMAATDIQPTRMDAAKAATESFVENQPAGVIVGVVAFSDSGISVQTPTSDDAAVQSAINRLQPQRGTSLGQGILASLQAISLAENPPATDYYSNRSPAPTETPAPVPPGSHTSAIIVLLSDGENNERPDPLAVAAAAANAGIRIYTVGIGSPAGTTLELNGFRVHTQLNEDLLKQIASSTGGEYFAAPDATTLQQVYDNLGNRLIVKPEAIEITGLIAGASLAILAVGGLLSLMWLGRLP